MPMIGLLHPLSPDTYADRLGAFHRGLKNSGYVEGTAGPNGSQIQAFIAGTSREINAAFATFGRERPDVLFVDIDPFFTSRRIQLVNLASRYAIPTTYPGRQFTEAGGLISYGSNLTDAWRQVGGYVGRILKGAKPADRPGVQAR